MTQTLHPTTLAPSPQTIPLNSPHCHESNVRKSASSPEGDANLVSSIKAHGLLSALIVVVGVGADQWKVVAGSRRLRALHALNASDALPKAKMRTGAGLARWLLSGEGGWIRLRYQGI